MLFYILLLLAVLSYLLGAVIGDRGMIKQIQSGMFYGFSLGCIFIFVFEVYKLLLNPISGE